MKINKVALLGAGAVGAYFIWGLSEKMGDNFCVVAKGERKERLLKNGIIINGKQYALNVKEPQELNDVDLLLVSSKQDALPGMLDDIKCMVNENTIVMEIDNEMINEDTEVGEYLVQFRIYDSPKKANRVSLPIVTFEIKK